MNPLFSYIGRRVGFIVIVLLFVVTITFILMHILAPNPITVWFGKLAGYNPTLMKLYISVYHLDQPLYVQWFYYVLGVFSGYWGISTIYHKPVVDVVAVTLPLTIQILIVSSILTGILGVFLGIAAARSAGRWPDSVITGFYFVSYVIPGFLLAVILMVIFAGVLKVLPSGGVASPGTPLPHPITYIPIIDALLEGKWSIELDLLRHLVLPSLANALASFGVITRVLKEGILDNLNRDFIRAARARGIPSRMVFSYAYKEASLPVVTLMALIVAGMLSGDVFVEYIFAYPGIGWYYVNAIYMYDYASVLALTFIFALAYILANLAADILYAVIDPRVRYSYGWVRV